METDQSARIVRGVLSLARRLRAEQPPGSVSLAAIGILATLRQLGPMPAVRLASEEGLQPQSLTRQIAALERGGLISRTASETDRRERVISITQRGLEVLATDMRARRKWLEGAISETLSDAERQTLLEASDAMIRLAGYERTRPSGQDLREESRNLHDFATKRERHATK